MISTNSQNSIGRSVSEVSLNYTSVDKPSYVKSFDSINPYFGRLSTYCPADGLIYYMGFADNGVAKSSPIRDYDTSGSSTGQHLNINRLAHTLLDDTSVAAGWDYEIPFGLCVFNPKTGIAQKVTDTRKSVRAATDTFDGCSYTTAAATTCHGSSTTWPNNPYYIAEGLPITPNVQHGEVVCQTPLSMIYSDYDNCIYIVYRREILHYFIELHAGSDGSPGYTLEGAKWNTHEYESIFMWHLDRFNIKTRKMEGAYLHDAAGTGVDSSGTKWYTAGDIVNWVPKDDSSWASLDTNLKGVVNWDKSDDSGILLSLGWVDKPETIVSNAWKNQGKSPDIGWWHTPDWVFGLYSSSSINQRTGNIILTHSSDSWGYAHTIRSKQTEGEGRGNWVDVAAFPQSSHAGSTNNNLTWRVGVNDDLSAKPEYSSDYGILDAPSSQDDITPINAICNSLSKLCDDCDDTVSICISGAATTEVNTTWVIYSAGTPFNDAPQYWNNGSTSDSSYYLWYGYDWVWHISQYPSGVTPELYTADTHSINPWGSAWSTGSLTVVQCSSGESSWVDYCFNGHAKSLNSDDWDPTSIIWSARPPVGRISSKDGAYYQSSLGYLTRPVDPSVADKITSSALYNPSPLDIDDIPKAESYRWILNDFWAKIFGYDKAVDENNWDYNKNISFQHADGYYGSDWGSAFSSENAFLYCPSSDSFYTTSNYQSSLVFAAITTAEKKDTSYADRTKNSTTSPNRIIGISLYHKKIIPAPVSGETTTFTDTEDYLGRIYCGLYLPTKNQIIYSWHNGGTTGGRLSIIDPYTYEVVELTQDELGLDLMPVAMIYYPPNDRIYFAASVSKDGKIGGNFTGNEGPFIVGVMKPADFSIERTYESEYVFTKIIHSKVDDKIYFVTSDFIKEDPRTVKPKLFVLTDSGSNTGTIFVPEGDAGPCPCLHDPDNFYQQNAGFLYEDETTISLGRGPYNLPARSLHHEGESPLSVGDCIYFTINGDFGANFDLNNTIYYHTVTNIVEGATDTITVSPALSVSTYDPVIIYTAYIHKCNSAPTTPPPTSGGGTSY